MDLPRRSDSATQLTGFAPLPVEGYDNLGLSEERIRDVNENGIDDVVIRMNGECRCVAANGDANSKSYSK